MEDKKDSIGADRYKQFLDAIVDMVLVKGPKSVILWANKSFQDYYGMDNKKLQGMIDASFNEPDYTQQYIKDDKKVFESGQILDILEEPVTRYDGVVRIFHTIKSPIFDDQGKVIMTIGISHDITEQKEADEKLKASFKELEKVNTLMMDRELKMVELKKEIEALKAKKI